MVDEMIYIYYDENNYVTGYGSDPEDRCFAAESIPGEVDRWLGCYRYEDGNYIVDNDRIAKRKEGNALQEEWRNLLTWFEYYDQQVTQYARATRLGQTFDKDISALDTEATANAKRINEIKTRLEEIDF